jgi:hypothetical protein
MAVVVYLDEVGNPTLDDSDRDFPVFGIALFICDINCYRDIVCPRVARLKFDFFGHEGVILHSRDIRKAQGDFGILTEPGIRARFMADLTAVMRECDYQVIGVAVRKDRHKAKYIYPADPYDLSLLFALERLQSVLAASRQPEVTIIAEKRGKEEDRKLHVAFQRIVTNGSAYVPAERFRTIRWTMRFLPKSMNIVGTQLADLVAYPMARHVLDSTKPNPAFDVVRMKLCKPLKIFP